VGCCKTPKSTFSASLVGLVGIAEEGLEPQNSPEIGGFSLLGPPKKGSVNLFDHHCKGKVFTNIFCAERFFPMCFV